MTALPMSQCGHQETLTRPGSCGPGRPVYTRHPTLKNEYTMRLTFDPDRLATIAYCAGMFPSNPRVD
jgi:hypothetical protein